MVADADADEVGLDVVGGEGEGGKQVFVEIVAGGYFLVKQQSSGERKTWERKGIFEMRQS